MSSLTTKKAIAYTLKDLLLEKPLSKITINDITSRCDINRQTFYYHFQDIYDLVEWMYIEEAEEVLKEKRNYSTWQEAFISIFELMKKDKMFVTNIYHSVSNEMLTKTLYRLIYPLIYDVVNERCVDKEIEEKDKIFIADFYKYSFIAILFKWIDEDMKEDPKAIVDKLSCIVTGTIDQAISSIK